MSSRPVIMYYDSLTSEAVRENDVLKKRTQQVKHTPLKMFDNGIHLKRPICLIILISKTAYYSPFNF